MGNGAPYGTCYSSEKARVSGGSVKYLRFVHTVCTRVLPDLSALPTSRQVETGGKRIGGFLEGDAVSSCSLSGSVGIVRYHLVMSEPAGTTAPPPWQLQLSDRVSII